MIVVDASAALGWCFPDEGSDYADAVLLALEGQDVVVPAIWPIEIVHALLVGERRKRISLADIQRFTELLKGLMIVEDTQSVLRGIADVLPLARQHGLSAYDAAYLDVAIRRDGQLATMDSALQRAARAAGVAIVAN